MNDRRGEECRRPQEHVLNLTRLELMRRRRGDSRELPTLPHFTAVRSMKQVVDYDFTEG